jgi:hypothetical protein
MSLFRCSKCGCVENTALSNFAIQVLRDGLDPLCSECDPTIRQWHNRFEKRTAIGMVMGQDGFLYSREQFDLKRVHHTKPDHIITE